MPLLAWPQRGARWKPCARAQLLQQSCRAFPANVLRQCRGCPPRQSLVPANEIPRSFWKKSRRRLTASFDEPVPVAAVDRWLARSPPRIAFDASRAGVKNALLATSSPRFLSGSRAGGFRSSHYGAGMAYLASSGCRISNPEDQRSARRRMEGALSFPYEAALRREAAKNDFDPCLPLASFARNPRFQADAVSPPTRSVDAGSSEDGKTSCQAAQSPLHEK